MLFSSPELLQLLLVMDILHLQLIRFWLKYSWNFLALTLSEGPWILFVLGPENISWMNFKVRIIKISSPDNVGVIGNLGNFLIKNEGKIFCIMFMAIGVPYFAYMTTVLSQNINQMLDDLRSLLACSELTIKEKF